MLRGFQKVAMLAPGTSTNVSFALGDRDLSVWDVGTHAWRRVAGEYGVAVGASSGDLRLLGAAQW